MTRRTPDEVNRAKILRGIYPLEIINPTTFEVLPQFEGYVGGYTGHVIWVGTLGTYPKRHPDRPPRTSFMSPDRTYHGERVIRMVWELWRYRLSPDYVVRHICHDPLCVLPHRDHNIPMPREESWNLSKIARHEAEFPEPGKVVISGYTDQERQPKKSFQPIPSEEEFLAQFKK